MSFFPSSAEPSPPPEPSGAAMTFGVAGELFEQLRGTLGHEWDILIERRRQWGGADSRQIRSWLGEDTKL